MINRYKAPPNIQQQYLKSVELICGISTAELAAELGICGRSYRDWKREKFPITQNAVEIIEMKYGIKYPYSKTKALNNWKKFKASAARSGGIARLMKHGNLGTPEGRSKGGRNALTKMRRLGIIPEEKPFHEPSGYSTDLAEFVGILLGDGHISKQQWSITLNSIADKDYQPFLVSLVERLFRFKPSVLFRKNSNAYVVYGGGKRSIGYLTSLGLKVGNKVKQQVGVPPWIKQSKVFSKACLRGLIDTDGGIFAHKYMVNGKQYSYPKLCFVNRSMPLLRFVYNTLDMLQLQPKLQTRRESKHVWLYNKEMVKKYCAVVGPSNPRLVSNI